MEKLLIASEFNIQTGTTVEKTVTDFIGPAENIAFIPTVTLPNELGKNRSGAQRFFEKIYLHLYKIDAIRYSPRKTRLLIENADALFISGSPQPYAQQMLFKEYGLKGPVTDFVRSGRPVVAISSAAMLLGPSMEPAKEHPNGSKSTFGIQDFSGFGAVPDVFWTHYQDAHQPLVDRLSMQLGLTITTISQQEILIRTDEKTTKINYAATGDYEHPADTEKVKVLQDPKQPLVNRIKAALMLLESGKIPLDSTTRRALLTNCSWAYKNSKRGIDNPSIVVVAQSVFTALEQIAS